MEAETKNYTADLSEPEAVKTKSKKPCKCARLGRGATKAEVIAMHRVKMLMKKQRRVEEPK